ncbi:MAG: response regulator [Flammeovirgaceae bacterium]|nr:response regulator [Flammeovirgaceae bacterium]
MKNSEIDVLLVEDNMGDAELTIRALKKNNLANKLIHLENGADALEYIFAEGIYANRILDNMPKLILLDLNMPKVGGIEVLRKIKSDERTKKIPVVILTSSKEYPDIEKCYNLGVNSYIVKPVEFANFVKAVDELGLYWLLLNQPPSR